MQAPAAWRLDGDRSAVSGLVNLMSAGLLNPCAKPPGCGVKIPTGSHAGLVSTMSSAIFLRHAPASLSGTHTSYWSYP